MAVVFMFTGVLVVGGLIASLSLTALARSVEREEQVLPHVRGNGAAREADRLDRVERLLEELLRRAGRDGAAPD